MEFESDRETRGTWHGRRQELLSYTASDDRVAARLLPENNNCSWPLSMLPVVKGVDPVSSVTTSTVPRSL